MIYFKEEFNPALVAAPEEPQLKRGTNRLEWQADAVGLRRVAASWLTPSMSGAQSLTGLSSGDVKHSREACQVYVL